MTIRRELEALRVRLDDAFLQAARSSTDPIRRECALFCTAEDLREYDARWLGGFLGTLEDLFAWGRAQRTARSGSAVVYRNRPVAELQCRGGRHGA
jgi:hypothetical protein